MTQRLTLSLFSLALIAAACGAQAAPEHEPFEVPTEIVPDHVNRTDTAALFPDDQCTIAVGTGVRVLSVVPGTPAEGVVHAGDIMTSIDGALVTTIEQLFSVLAGRIAGETVAVAGTRAGQAIEFDVELAPAADGTERAIVGLVSETRLDPSLQDDLGSSTPLTEFSLPVLLNGRLYVHDPLGSSWLEVPDAPAVSTAILNSHVYAALSPDGLTIARLDDGVSLLFNPVPFESDGPEGPVTLTPSGFEVVLGSVGDLLMVGGWAANDSGAVRTIFGIDVDAGRIEWGRRSAVAFAGNQLVPLVAHRNPSGTLTAVGLAEQDQLTGDVLSPSVYFLMDESGAWTLLPGWEQLKIGGELRGWIDDDTLLYVSEAEPPVIYRWTAATGEREGIVSVAEEHSIDLVDIVPLGDGRHLMQIRQGDVTLLDIDAKAFATPIARGCSYITTGGLAG